MAGKRQPTEKVIAEGRKHLTKAEAEIRLSQEPKGPGDLKQLRAPEWLTDPGQRKEFNVISKQLLQLLPGLMIRYDAESIAAFVRYRGQWLQYSGEVEAMLEEGVGNKAEMEALEGWSRLQEKAFKSCRALAADLGLTLSSRCQLVIPQAPAAEADPLDQLLSQMGGD